MILGSLPTATIYGTWTENIEVTSVDDDTLYDLSSVTEISLRLFSSYSRGGGPGGFAELSITMTQGAITLPAPGIIQWRVEAGAMGAMRPGLYEAVMLLEDSTDKVPLFLGPISIVG